MGGCPGGAGVPPAAREARTGRHRTIRRPGRARALGPPCRHHAPLGQAQGGILRRPRLRSRGIPGRSGGCHAQRDDRRRQHDHRHDLQSGSVADRNAALSLQTRRWTGARDSCIRQDIVDTRNLVEQRPRTSEAPQRLRRLLSAAPVLPAVPEPVGLVEESPSIPVRRSERSAIWNELMVTERPL